jgi:hypothetical protein
MTTDTAHAPVEPAPHGFACACCAKWKFVAILALLILLIGAGQAAYHRLFPRLTDISYELPGKARSCGPEQPHNHLITGMGCISTQLEGDVVAYRLSAALPVDAEDVLRARLPNTSVSVRDEDNLVIVGLHVITVGSINRELDATLAELEQQGRL